MLFIGSQFLVFNIVTIARIRNTSPSRFVIIVRILALSDRELL